MKIEKTEILGDEVTPEARRAWKKEKRQIEIRLLPYSAGAFFSAMLESGLLIALSVLLERFINNISGGFEVAVFAGIIAVMAVRAVMVFFENFFYNRACLTVQHIIAVTLYKRALAHDELLKKCAPAICLVCSIRIRTIWDTASASSS